MQIVAIYIAGWRDDANRVALLKGGKIKHRREVGSLAQKKFPPANQSRRSAQEYDLPFLPHGLITTRSMHLHRRFHFTCRHRRYCRRARTCPRRVRLTNSALEESDAHVVLPIDRNQFYIDALLELGIALNPSRLVPPVLRKLIYE